MSRARRVFAAFGIGRPLDEQLHERLLPCASMRFLDNVLLGPMTSLPVGGPARRFVEVGDEEALVTSPFVRRALNARARQRPWHTPSAGTGAR